MASSNLSGLHKILCCPDTHQPLTEADAELIARVNGAIRRGEVRTRDGRAMTEVLEGALVRQDGRWLYPVRQGIPVLLTGSAIALGAAPPADPRGPSQAGG